MSLVMSAEVQLDKYILTDISYIEGSVKDIDNVKLANFCFNEGVRYDEDSTGSRYEDFKIPSCDEWDKILENIQYQYFKVYKTTLHLSEHWAHIHKKYESTNIHHHVNIDCMSKDPDISGVYYVQVPENSGKLVFEYNINQYQTKRFWVEPIVGNFFLFPSTLNHFVTKNMGDDLRISISFNLKSEQHDIN